MDPRLYKSAKSGNLHLLEQLLTENPSLLLKLTPHENTALHIAVRFGHKNIVAEVYSRRQSLLAQPNLDGDTPLHLAARAGNFSVVNFLVSQILLSSRRDIEEGSNTGIEILRMGNIGNNTVLHEAVRNYHLRVVELLIKVDQELACLSNKTGESPLYLAARDGMVQIVNQILISTRSSAHGGSDGQTALHASVIAGHFGITEALLRVKPRLTREVDHHGRTPLHYAASFGDQRTVQKLLELDTATAYILDKDGHSPLHVTASKGHTNVIKKFIRYCPDSGELLDLNGQNALHFAVLRGKVNVVRYMLETTELEGLINQADSYGNTPLHLAGMERQTRIVGYLMWDGKVDRRTKNKSGQTAMDIDASIREPHKTFLPILISSNWRQLSSPCTSIIREKTPPSANHEGAAATTQTYKQMGNTLLMVVTLITTITFSAAFTMPGGYNNNIGPDQGLALLQSKKLLKWFVISDTIAMNSSITAALVILWGVVSSTESYFYYLASAVVLTYIALQSTTIAFTMGVMAVMPHQPFVHTVGFIVGLALDVGTSLFLFKVVQIFSICEAYHFLMYRLCKLKSKFINR